LPQGSLPLPTLLSQALVAFTIEFDNEAEHQIPHRTTSFGSTGAGDTVWLVSLAMWENCMRFVGDEPITVRELHRLARTRTNLDGMRRWGYVTIDGTPERIRTRAPGPDAVLRATARGQLARQIWQPLAGLIEQRWRDRCGSGAMSALRRPLEALATSPPDEPPPLFQALRPYPENWRAKIPPAASLPHYPMVLNRCGYPDGS
jgi:hypothetical protein